MNNKKYKKRNKSTLNIYGGGGKIDSAVVDKAISGISGAMGVAESFLKNNEIDNTAVEQAKSHIETESKKDYSKFGSLDDAFNAWNDRTFFKQDYNMKDFRGSNFGQQLLNTGQGVISGASAGSKISGGLGGIIGGAVGLAAGVAGIFSGNAKAKKAARETNFLAEQGEERQEGNILANMESAMGQQNLNYALNYSKFGGPLHTKGGIFDTGLSFIDEGYTHEDNMYGGVPMGVDPEGNPNLVEGGEVVLNSNGQKYVFSNSVYATEDILAQFGLPKKYANASYAYIVDKATKEEMETPNDPISKRSLDDKMMRIIQAQEMTKAKQNKNNNLNKFTYGGIPLIGSSRNNTTATRDPLFLYSLDKDNVNTPYSEWLTNYNNKKQKDFDMLLSSKRTFKDGGKPEIKQGEDGKYHITGATPIIDPNKKDSYAKELGLPISNSFTRDPKVAGKPGIIGLQTKDIHNKIMDDIEYRDQERFEKATSSIPIEDNLARYASVINTGLGLFENREPDMTGADMIARERAKEVPISYSPLTHYMTPKPFDRAFYLNKMYGNAAGSRASIRNSAGNRAQALGTLVASDYNTLGAIGDLNRQAEEYNYNNYKDVLDFNRATDIQNLNTAVQANSQRLQQRSLNADLAVKEAALRDAAIAAVGQARSNNRNAFAEDLSNIGRENVIFNMINKNPELLYEIAKSGDISLKNKAKCGGKLLTKKRRK